MSEATVLIIHAIRMSEGIFVVLVKIESHVLYQWCMINTLAMKFNLRSKILHNVKRTCKNLNIIKAEVTCQLLHVKGAHVHAHVYLYMYMYKCM